MIKLLGSCTRIDWTQGYVTGGNTDPTVSYGKYSLYSAEFDGVIENGNELIIIGEEPVNKRYNTVGGDMVFFVLSPADGCSKKYNTNEHFMRYERGRRFKNGVPQLIPILAGRSMFTSGKDFTYGLYHDEKLGQAVWYTFSYRLYDQTKYSLNLNFLDKNIDGLFFNPCTSNKNLK